MNQRRLSRPRLNEINALLTALIALLAVVPAADALGSAATPSAVPAATAVLWWLRAGSVAQASTAAPAGDRLDSARLAALFTSLSRLAPSSTPIDGPWHHTALAALATAPIVAAPASLKLKCVPFGLPQAHEAAFRAGVRSNRRIE